MGGLAAKERAMIADRTTLEFKERIRQTQKTMTTRVFLE
jgi:hypothetical protein